MLKSRSCSWTSVTNVDLVWSTKPNFSLPLIKFNVGLVPDFAHTLCYYSRITNETVRERSRQVRWSSQLLQRQLVLCSHILWLENSAPLRMATFNDNLNQPTPPECSKKRGHPCSFWVQKVGAIASDRVLRIPRGVRKDQCKKLHKSTICGGRYVWLTELNWM